MHIAALFVFPSLGGFICICTHTCISFLFGLEWKSVGHILLTILWNRTHLCICFVQQEDDLPSPELAPKQLVPKSEPVDSNPAKPTPSAHAQSATPSSKSSQKRKSGGGDANTSNGATSKKIKIEPVCSCFILHTTHVKFELQSYNHKLHQFLSFKISLFLGI